MQRGKNSIAPSKRASVVDWGLSQRFEQLLRGTMNKGYSSSVIYARHFRLCASAWFTTGIQAVRGHCRRILAQFSQIWSDVIGCGPM